MPFVCEEKLRKTKRDVIDTSVELEIEATF